MLVLTEADWRAYYASISNFYLYAQRHAQGPSNEVVLSNIIPVERTAPIVAAQAFYRKSLHCDLLRVEVKPVRADTLMLASKGLFKIYPQEEAYGEVSFLISIP
jgi:hypothetical protein